MLRIEDVIRISAPLEIVWDVTLDIERWPEWSPTVTSVQRMDQGLFGRGSKARIKQPLQPEAEWVVTEFVDGQRFSWESYRRGLHIIGTHELSSRGADTCSLLRVEATGAVAVLAGPLLRVAMRRALSDENRGLKTRCEYLQSSPKTISGPHLSGA